MDKDIINDELDFNKNLKERWVMDIIRTKGFRELLLLLSWPGLACDLYQVWVDNQSQHN